MPIGSNISLNSEMEPKYFFFLSMPVQHHLSCTEASLASPRIPYCPGYPHKMTMNSPRVVFLPLGVVADGVWDNSQCAQPR